VFRILQTGNWHAGDVSQAWAPSTRRIVPEVESAIETAWTAAMARPNVHLFDGPMCRLESANATDTRLRLELSKTSYKIFLGTNMAHPEFADQFGPEVMANPVGLSPALLTSDGYLLLGHRSDRVAYYPGRIHPFSGSLEPADADLFSAVGRELKEELSLDTADISEIRCTGIVEDASLRQPELIFAAESIRTRTEIESRLDQLEHQSIFAIPASAEGIENALRNESRLTPVAIASLRLWGRLRFDHA
jgi:8-oxo-dGTP pyrophosphatase MutT (NUDIX family)